MGGTRDAPRPESSRRRAWLSAGAVALASLLFQPTAARALTTQFVLSPSQSLVAMNGDFTNYASNTALSFRLDFDQAVGSVIPVSFGNFTLPDVQIALGGRYSFSVQSPQNGFSGTLDLATGAILSNPVTVLLQQISSNGVVSSSSIFSLSLTTGTINRGACGQFAGGAAQRHGDGPEHGGCDPGGGGLPPAIGAEHALRATPGRGDPALPRARVRHAAAPRLGSDWPGRRQARTPAGGAPGPRNRPAAPDFGPVR